MTDNTPRITDARELQNLTLRELLKQGYLLTQERDKHSRMAMNATWNGDAVANEKHSTRHGELDALIVEYERVLGVSLHPLSVYGLLTERKRVANEQQCLPNDPRRKFALAAITEYIYTRHPKVAELEHMNLQSVITGQNALDKERDRQAKMATNHHFNFYRHPRDPDLTQKYETTEANVVRIDHDLDSYRGVIHYRVEQMPLAKILAVIKTPSAQPEDPVQQLAKKAYRNALGNIVHNKLEHIRWWENQVASREITQHFPSLFELEADSHFWREWAVLRQAEENVPYMPQHDTALANAYATRLEAVTTERRAMLQGDCRLLLATGLHPRLGETSPFQTLDQELVKMVADIAFPWPLVPPPEAPPEA